MNALAISLQTYFTTFAHTQRDLSVNTIAYYRDARDFRRRTRLRRRHRYARHRVPRPPRTRTWQQHQNPQRPTHRGPLRARPRPARPSRARRHHHPGPRDPTQTHNQARIEFLTPVEVDALLAAPDPATWTGRRDHALLAMTTQTGLRISESCSLTHDGIHLGTGPHIACTGKGRRQRITPLTRATASTMTTYLAERMTRPGSALFCGPHGQPPLSRDALEHRLAKHLATARTTCPSLSANHVTMHTLRHTAAMNLLSPLESTSPQSRYGSGTHPCAYAAPGPHHRNHGRHSPGVGIRHHLPAHWPELVVSVRGTRRLQPPVIGWAIDEHLHTDLVQGALEMAVAMRGEIAERVILHADRGCQYTSAQLVRFDRENNLTRSVGRTAVCWDNAKQESFWATLKVELYDRYLWPTKAAAKPAVGDWIERVYNRRTRHSAIAMISPVDFEDRLTQTAQAARPCVHQTGASP